MHHSVCRAEKLFTVMGLLALLCVSAVHAEPYRPYPVVFVHGLNGGAWHWGVWLTEREYERLRNGEGGGDFTYIPSNRVMDDHMIARLWQLFTPYARGDTNYLAALSLDDPSGSIDEGPYVSGDTIRYWYKEVTSSGDTVSRKVEAVLANRGAGYELQHFIKQVLFTYYDTTWNLNPDAKVVLVAHSMGGDVVAEALRQDPSLKQHVWKVITLASPLRGAHQLRLSYREGYLPLVIGNYPLFQFATAWMPVDPRQLFLSYWIGQAVSRCAGNAACDESMGSCLNHGLFTLLLGIADLFPGDVLSHLFRFGVSAIWLGVTRDLV